MRDAINALETALAGLEQARDELPEDLRSSLDDIVAQSRSVLESLRRKAATEDADPADATG